MNSQASRFFTSSQQLQMAHAIEQGDTSTITHLLQSHVVSPNDYGLVRKKEKSDEQPISFLTYAVMVKDKAAIEALLLNGADVNAKTPDGWSALAEAARSPDETLLQILLDKGGNADLVDNAGRPLTFTAYNAGRLQNMNLLLDRGAHINAQDSTQETLLMTMADLNDYQHMLDLLQRGADPRVSSKQQNTTVAWTVQESAGRLTPDRERLRQQVIQVLESKGLHFPVPAPQTYEWSAEQHKFVLPGK